MSTEDFLRWANVLANYITAGLIIWLGIKIDKWKPRP